MENSVNVGGKLVIWKILEIWKKSENLEIDCKFGILFEIWKIIVSPDLIPMLLIDLSLSDISNGFGGKPKWMEYIIIKTILVVLPT